MWRRTIQDVHLVICLLQKSQEQMEVSHGALCKQLIFTLQRSNEIGE